MFPTFGFAKILLQIPQMSSSNDYMVVLQRVEVDMTGRYTCEVSTEDHFETVREEAEMEVIGGEDDSKIPTKKM